MRRLIPAALAALALGLPTAAPAQDADALAAEGQRLFEENCTQCHRESGRGIPPSFPALDGNEALADLAHVVRRVRAGKEAMPAFPDFSPRQIAAVASYIRTAWSNAYGPVETAEVEEILPYVQMAEAERTIWDGVYTARQARDARLLYLGGCAPCHGSRLNGAPDEADMSPGPPLAGTIFLREWDGRTLASLYELVRNTMPVRNPGQFSDQEYADIIAYMLHFDEDIPAGDEPLEPDLDTLGNIEITQEPEGD